MTNQNSKPQIISIEDLCDEKFSQNILRSLSRLNGIELDVGVKLHAGKLNFRATVDVPARLPLFLFAIGSLGVGAVNNKALILKLMSYL